MTQGDPRRASTVSRPSRAPLRASGPLAGRGAYLGTYRGPGGLFTREQILYLTGGDYPTDRPRPATEREAMGLPPFGRGVALLANAVAGTDWQAVRLDPETGVSVPWVPQPAVLTNPVPSIRWTDTEADGRRVEKVLPGLTVWHYRWALVSDLVLYGNTFGLCGPTDHATRRPATIDPVHAERVALLQDPETGAAWWTVDGELREPYVPDPGDPAADPGVLPDYAGQVFHISAGNRSGEILGLGILAQYADWLGGSVAAEVHAGSYFAGGALPPAVLQSPQALTQVQADDLKERWRSMVNTREPVVLPTGYVLTPIVSDALNAQLVESRQWNAAAVAMMLGIPSYKLGLSGPSMTYQNVESADIEFIRDSVARYASPIAQAFSDFLMPRGTTVSWQYAQRMRADQKTTAEVVNSYVASGVLTTDEARQMLGRQPLPDDPEPEPDPEPVPDPEPEPDDAPAPAPESVDDAPATVAPVGR